MAGKRQHYIPRFFLRGFSSRTSDQKTFVWYFRKDMDAAEVSIRDIALEKSFYGDPGAYSLDSTITEKESDFARVIDFVRERGQILESDLEILIDFVHNMIIQTRHTRKSLTDGFSKIVNVVSTKLSDQRSASQLLKRHVKKDKKNFKNQIRTEVRKNLGFKNPMIEEPVIRLIEENLEVLASQIGPMFAQVLEMFSSQIQKEGKRAHNDALKRLYQDAETSTRSEEYRRLKWSVKKFEPNSFILGDIGVLQMDLQSHDFHPAIVSKVKNGVLLLPIAHDTLLIGSSCDDLTLPSSEEINTNMAEISAEFFIASRNSEQERSLSNRLGNRSELIDDKLVEELEKEYS